MATSTPRLSHVGKVCFVVVMVGVLTQILNVNPVQCSSLLEEVQNSYRQRDSFQHCGSQLASFIKAFCDSHANLQGLYAGPGHGPKILEPDRSQNPYFHSRNRENTLENKYQSIYSRVPRSVNDECCVKPCKESQLLKYCAIRDSYEDDTSLEPTTTAKPVSVFSDENWTIEEEDSISLNDLPLIPLLINLLWQHESSPNTHPVKQSSPPVSVTFRRFTPAVDNQQKIKGHPIHIPRIIPRDTHQIRPSISTKQRPKSRYRPLSSDETPRDLFSSEEPDPPPSSPEKLTRKEPMESQAVQIEDDLPLHSFPIPGGTNSDWVVQ